MNPQDPYTSSAQPTSGSQPPVYPAQPPHPNQTGGYDVVPPLQPTTGPGNGGHNPYEFIFTEAPKQKKRLFGGSMRSKVLMVVGGLVVVTILVVIATSLFSSSGAANDRLLTITQEQQEIIRVATLGSTKATSSEVRNFALNTQLGITTNQKAIITYLDERGTKTDEKILALNLNSDTDTTLDKALTNSTYDRTFTDIVRSQLVEYRSHLGSTYRDVTGENARKILRDCDAAAALLVAQADKLAPVQTEN